METPNNFWSVEIQPRAVAIKIVVRTDEDALLPAGVPYTSERPPSYFAMRICDDGDIEAALQFLAMATRTPKGP